MKFHPWEPDLITLVSRIDAGEIDLQPDFQRQEVWPISKQRKLIDTILREWSMPPIHLIDSGGSTLEVLDGQQRLAAIRDFVHGKFKIDGTITPFHGDISALDGVKYISLPTDVKRRVDRYTVRSFRISDFAPEEPSELFYRLNQPTLLTAGEQRNSLYGPARSQLKELVKQFQAENAKEDIGFSNARLAYDDVLARQLYFLGAGTMATKATEGQISDAFRNSDGFDAAIIDIVRSSIEQFSKARRNVGKVRLNKASLLSWLLFYSRGEPADEKEYFFTEFLSIGYGTFVPEVCVRAKALFNDRASGRVTDISSVVLRDICIWMCYDAIFDMRGPDRSHSTELERVFTSYNNVGDDLDLENIITSVLSIEQWGAIS
jgi:hypothetical protein